MTFSVTPSSVSSQTVTVNYKTKNSTVVAGSDYIAKEGTITFAPGEARQTLRVSIIGDTQFERNENFKVILNNPVNALIEDSKGEGTIVNDEAVFTGISDNEKSNNAKHLITVTPNPATSAISIMLNGFMGSTILSLTDMKENLLKTVKLQISDTKSTQQQLDIASLTNGTYFITVQDQGTK